MKVTYEWIRDYVEIDVDIKHLIELLTMTGTKVEGYEFRFDFLSNVVVGKILSIEKHPNADKLNICKVDIGKKIVQVITAAQNIFPNALVPVALEGATVSNNKRIEKIDFMGYASEGMMLSIDELGLSKAEIVDAPDYGIYIINKPCTPGDDIKKVLSLSDILIDFEITSNRPDCLSVYGIAREIATILNKKLKQIDLNIKEQVDEINNYLDSIEIENPNICYRYIGKIVKDVKICPSPEWMRRRLASCGIRPINNIVDITNYVMLEIGQPMHAFDYNKLKSRKILVRLAKEGEKITTLDGNQRQLRAEDIVITNGFYPIAIAGVMGGEDTEIDANTTTILLESATFNYANIRKTAKYFGLRTEASSRFEKGLSPYFAELAINRACALIEKLGYGTIVDGCIDTYVNKAEQKKIDADFDFINKFLGVNISKEEIIDILMRLDIEYKTETSCFIIPPFRTDISSMEDIAEEVIRIYGYDKIPSTINHGSAVSRGLTKKQIIIDKIRNYFADIGYFEIYNYSFESPKVYNVLKGFDLNNAIIIKNPLGEDFSVMRMQLLNSMLKSIYTNYSRNIKNIKLFEVSNVFSKSNNILPYERLLLSIGTLGNVDFYVFKGYIENLLLKFGIRNVKFVSHHSNQNFHPTRSARIFLDEIAIGYIGEIHPDILENYDIHQRVYYSEIDIDQLTAIITFEKKYKPLPKYPSIERDYAFIVPEQVESSSIEGIFRKYANDLIEEFYLFDIYKGEQVQKGYSSYAYKIVYRSSEKTLNDDEINQLQRQILDDLSKLHVRLRD